MEVNSGRQTYMPFGRPIFSDFRFSLAVSTSNTGPRFKWLWVSGWGISSHGGLQRTCHSRGLPSTALIQRSFALLLLLPCLTCCVVILWVPTYAFCTSTLYYDTTHNTQHTTHNTTTVLKTGPSLYCSNLQTSDPEKTTPSHHHQTTGEPRATVRHSSSVTCQLPWVSANHSPLTSNGR